MYNLGYALRHRPGRYGPELTRAQIALGHMQPRREKVYHGQEMTCMPMIAKGAIISLQQLTNAKRDVGWICLL